ncbi:hypothetical protein C8J57DRAFT_1634668 [Mycena rebaudengoi]|nr:hypothetical protein C8J57DRAFT_1634668 [Mycena rebaudengoi]
MATSTIDKSTVDKVHKAINSYSDGHEVDASSYMAFWCANNWGQLLQPAPLSISVLGSIIIVASSTTDFSLENKTPGAPTYTWTYVKDPKSFKTCLQQMVGAGYTAFDTAQKDMNTINAASGQMPSIMENIVDILANGKSTEISTLLKQALANLQKMSKMCHDAATSSNEAFTDLSGLAQEILLACTYTMSETEQAVQQNQIQLKVLQTQKTGQAKMLKDAQANKDFMKKSYLSYEKDWKHAMDAVPTGWELVGMQFVSSLTAIPTAISHAFMSHASASADSTADGTNGFSKGSPAPAATPMADTTSPNGVNSQPNTNTLIDPAVTCVQQVLDQVNFIKLLLAGKGGKPDWERIQTTDSAQNGALYIKASLTQQQKQLDKTKPVSQKLSGYIDRALAIMKVILDTADQIATPETRKDAVLDAQMAPTTALSQDVSALLTTTNLLLQKAATTATGPATPQTTTSDSSDDDASGADLAVQSAKASRRMKVDQARAELDATRASYDAACGRLVEQQKEITTTIGQITSLSLTDTTLDKMMPVLRQAIGTFSTLRTEFSRLCLFFDNVSTLLVDVMGPSVDRWVDTWRGVTLDALTRDLIYRQILLPMQVSLLATKISTVYVSISDQHIRPALEMVSTMLKFPAGTTAEDHTKLIASLTKSQSELLKQATAASSSIATEVHKNQKDFKSQITARMTTIENAVKSYFPDITGPIPTHLKNITDAHVHDTDATRALRYKANPTFNPATAL